MRTNGTASCADKVSKMYYAKSANGHHCKIANKQHLQAVAKMAEGFGREIDMSEEAYLAGLFHDFGKYGEAFQAVLNGDAGGVDHAFSSAAMLFDLRKKRKYVPIIQAVQGHHGGLETFDKQALEKAMRDPDFDECPSGKTASLRGKAEYETALKAFKSDFPSFTSFPKLPQRDASASVTADMLDTRMLFSCLVDADYSVSAADDEPDGHETESAAALDAEVALRKLLLLRESKRKSSTAASAVNALRDEVFELCGDAGEKPAGLFTLTAPTGVGKTMAMMHFALRQCIANGHRRIIVVLPFLALAEQTEQDYKKIFCDLLVDHSQKELSDGERIMAARWDAPVIITTSVRFFESLFADKATDCRKLHNIAGSVILFDEAQSLPTELIKPTLEAVERLCGRYGCTMLFSTATQPDYTVIDGAPWQPTEIVPDSARLFSEMRRVSTEWRLYKNEARKDLPTLNDIADEMRSETNVCCIVNLRRHAKQLAKTLSSCDGVYLLSSDLCPAHRLKTVAEIKARQERKEPCRVVATQCIEAGVDLDFDVMYRSLAPMEAIVQAAGRCNRNGKLPHGGRLIVFEPNEDGKLYPKGNAYEDGATAVKLLQSADGNFDPSDPERIKSYYKIFFAKNRDRRQLNNAIAEENYKKVAKEYRLIDNEGIRIIVPYDGEAELFREIKASNEGGRISMALLAKAAPITVSTFDGGFLKAVSPLHIKKHGQDIETGYYILNSGFERYYDPLLGLTDNGTAHDDFII